MFTEVPQVLNGGPKGGVVQRNVWWSLFFTRLLVSHADLRAEFPEGVDVFILPKGDDELIKFNLDLAESRPAEKRRVFVRIAVEDASVAIQPLLSEQTRRYALA